MKKAFYNFKIDILNTEEVLKKCDLFYTSPNTHTLFFLNAHCFNIAQKDHAYLNAVNNSNLLLNDGIGLKLASYLTGSRFKENLNGTDLIPRLLNFAAQKGKKVFLFGGKQGVAEKAAHNAQLQIPDLQIAGCHSGYFTDQEESQIVNKILDTKTDLLILGMGVPKQEMWAEKNKKKLKQVSIIVAGGAILDFISGEIHRAPGWIRKIHMEWLYRLYLEPKRMWKRYLVGNVVFFFHAIRLKLYSA